MNLFGDCYAFVSFSWQKDITPLPFSIVTDIKIGFKGSIKKIVVTQARHHRIKHLYHVLLQYFTVHCETANLKVLGGYR
jgi:hypothetical protein